MEVVRELWFQAAREEHDVVIATHGNHLYFGEQLRHLKSMNKQNKNETCTGERFFIFVFVLPANEYGEIRLDGHWRSIYDT